MSGDPLHDPTTTPARCWRAASSGRQARAEVSPTVAGGGFPDGLNLTYLPALTSCFAAFKFRKRKPNFAITALVRTPRAAAAKKIGGFLSPACRNARCAELIAMAPGAAGAVGGAAPATPWQCGGGAAAARPRVGSPAE